jgi:hypothetical protein
LRAAAVSLAAMAVGPLDTAIAAPPNVTITSPLNGSVSNNQTPSFSGLAEEAGGEMTLRLYNGTTAAGTAVQELSTLLFSLGGTWYVGPAEALGDGTYTAQATQTTLSHETRVSSPVHFTVNHAAPTITFTFNAPPSPSDDTTPSFTGTASDTAPITVHIHAGPTAKGTIVSMAPAAGTGAGWTSGNASPALSIGTYTAVATQASNPAGISGSVTFTVTAPPAITTPTPPLASFNWFPSAPQTGEPVALVSTSTDAASPITGIAWALTGNGPFQGGGTVLTTSFSAPGAHVVRLRVTDAKGVSSVATETINVLGPGASLQPFPGASLMQPFPVVRIAGTETASAVKLRLLKVQQTPTGARITVRCKGRGCPVKAARRVAVSNDRGVAPVEFRQFERTLRAGVTLEILVSMPGEIGKYTRFTIRRGKLPERVDMCLDPAGVRPLVCPSS